MGPFSKFSNLFRRRRRLTSPAAPPATADVLAAFESALFSQSELAAERLATHRRVLAALLLRVGNITVSDELLAIADTMVLKVEELPGGVRLIVREAAPAAAEAASP
jgi:hypothetical protein